MAYKGERLVNRGMKYCGRRHTMKLSGVIVASGREEGGGRPGLFF